MSEVQDEMPEPVHVATIDGFDVYCPGTYEAGVGWHPLTGDRQEDAAPLVVLAFGSGSKEER